VRSSDLRQETNGWETQSRASRYADDHLEVVVEKVKSPSRDEAKTWTTVRRKPAVVIAPLTQDGHFVLVRQERIPIRAALWEMPAGQIDSSQEPSQEQIETTALRELGEETGHVLASGGELIGLGEFYSSPGFTDERCFFFLARPVEPAGAKSSAMEAESIIDCRAFSATELRRMIIENEIRDANTLSICCRLAAAGFLTLAPT
jgi:ADP-ribose pyrophosphatase